MARKCLEKEEEVKILKKMKMFPLKMGGPGSRNFLGDFSYLMTFVHILMII